MKLERKNKYNGKAISLAAIIASGLLLCGCNDVSAKVVEPTPTTEIVEITPTPKPTPKPTPSPIPTMKPNPVLTDEEIIEKFGVVNSDMVVKHNTIIQIEYVTNGENKISFGWVAGIPVENGTSDIYDLFTNNVLFTIENEMLTLEFSKWNDSLIAAANENLGDTKFISIITMHQIREYFEKKNIYITNSEYDDILNYMYWNGESTILEYAKLYATIIPEEYWITWEDLGYVTSNVKVR